MVVRPGSDPADPEPAQPFAALSPERRETFELRRARWWPDLHAGLSAVYSPDATAALEARLDELAERAYADRDPRLHRLDQERTLAPDWFQQPRMLGYAAYADRFAGSLAAVAEQVPYLRELGVTYL